MFMVGQKMSANSFYQFQHPLVLRKTAWFVVGKLWRFVNGCETKYSSASVEVFDADWESVYVFARLFRIIVETTKTTQRNNRRTKVEWLERND